MGTDDFFKKKHAELEERKKERLTPKPNSFLIVSEGEKTEPLYFEGLANYINDKYAAGNRSRPIIQTSGEGKCTVSLVNEAERIVSRAKIMYSQVWVVFDKDDFDDFDEAVDLCEKKGFKSAWSNQSFEYWIFLHFQFSDSDLHRDAWCNKLDEIFKNNNIPNGYEKNNPQIFDIVTSKGSLKAAVSNANRIEESHSQKGIENPSKRKPGTTVHHLIAELKEYLKDLMF